MKLVQDDVVGKIGEAVGGAFDLRDARKESEDAALRLAERAPDRGGDRILDPQLRLAADVTQRQRIAPAFAFDHGRAVHQRGKSRTVERRRHRDDAKVGPERRLHVERERQPEIAVEAALVHLVEQDGGDARELGIGLDACDEDALRDHRDPGRGRTLAVHAGRVAEGLADGFARGRRHPFGGSARRKAAGREQKDLAGAPWLGEQGRRNRGGLARTRRRDEHRR